MKLSIVATLYQSAQYIEEFCWRAGAAARQLVDDDYEIVLVNDGSPDDSLARAVRLTELDSHVIVVDLSRNFGHHKAMMTGLSHAQGEQVFLIDSDLEEEPEWLQSFAEQMERDRCDVVYGVQEQRKGSLYERWTGKWFYLLFRTLSGFALPENLITARLMTRRYVNALLLHRDGQPLHTLWCLDLVAVTPVAAGILHVVIKNKFIHRSNQIEIALPGDVVGLDNSDSLRDL